LLGRSEGLDVRHFKPLDSHSLLLHTGRIMANSQRAIKPTSRTCILVRVCCQEDLRTLNSDLLNIVTKKNEIMLFSGKWKQLDINMLPAISQTEKDKYHMQILDLKKMNDMIIR
jgi:hypothetical protein